MNGFDELQQAALFKDITGHELEGMLQCLGPYEKSYRKGEYIILEQDRVSCIGLVLAGTVDMVKEDVWGNKTILVRIRQHQLFGETFACSKDARASVTFCASGNCRILFLQFERVMHVCSNSCVFHHRLIENMVKEIADKNRRLLEKIEVVAKKTLREKIMAYLSRQAQLQDSRCFEIPLGRVELAEYLCTDRSALTRELSRMKADGLIDYKKNSFELIDF